jgi:proline racemase
VIFFNNVGTLGMCGHGVLGVVATLAHLGRLGPGRHRLETPVGPVTTELHGDGSISVENVPSHRRDADVRIDVPGVGPVRGDVAYGGNWFFLVEDASTPLDLDHVSELLVRTGSIRGALADAGITGADGAEIDHVELFGPARSADAHARNFVLCPGGAYDRSPCGTGTSAKVACLAADGKLAEGETWIQESVIGSRFTVTYRRAGNAVVPTLTGRAFVTAEGDLVLDDRDPFREGIPA